MKIKKIFNSMTNIWLFSFILLLLSISPIERLIAPGIDASYQYAFNYFFAHNIQIGKDILFSFGPLGFLLWPQSQGDNLLIAMIVIYSSKYIFILISLNLYYLTQEKMTITSWLIIIILIYIILSSISIHNLFIFMPLIFLLTYFIKPNIFWLLSASFIVSIALLIKASAGIIALLFLFSFSIYSIWNRDYKSTLYIFTSITIIFSLIWFLLYENFEGIYDYFYATLELSRGNSSAMTINPNNNWWSFSGFSLLLLYYPFMKREKILFFLFIISFFSITAAFKYAVAREDHIFYFAGFIIEFIFITFLVTKNFTLKNLLYLSFSYFLFLVFIYKTPYKDRIEDHFTHYIPALKINTLDLLNIKENTLQLQKKSKLLLSFFILNKEDRMLIGKKSVDVYPWDASYIAANDLHWKPRPIFQSYIAYTSYLDMKNSNFIKSNSAPEFIIWQKKHWGGEVGSIDNRYLFNDEPLTLYEILNHYTVVSNRSTYLVLKRTTNKLSSKIILTKSYKWNEWIEVPKINAKKNSTFLIAKTDIQRSVIQKIKKLIYKEFKVYITYKLSDGSEKHYRFVPDTAKNGLWITPLLDTLFKLEPKQDVVAIKLIHHKYDYFKQDLTIRWSLITAQASLFK